MREFRLNEERVRVADLVTMVNESEMPVTVQTDGEGAFAAIGVEAFEKLQRKLADLEFVTAASGLRSKNRDSRA